MAEPIPLLRVSTFLPFVNFLNKIGTPTENLLKTHKLPIFALDDPQSFMPRHQVFNFLERAASQEGIENLGFFVAEKTPLNSLGSLGYLTCNSPTLRGAINMAIKVSKVFNSRENFWLIERENQAWFCQAYRNLNGQDPYHAAHFSLMLMIELIQKVAGTHWFPTVIYSQSRHFNAGVNHPINQSKIFIKQGMTAICLPRYFLSFPLAPVTDDHQRKYEELQASAPSSTFIISLQQAIASQLREGYPSIHLAAEISQMSVRSLQRNLAKESLTYSQLITHLRHQKALRLLQDSNLKMIDIAAELGYSDPAHFTRAFKTWTGRSPKDFRFLNIVVD